MNPIRKAIKLLGGLSATGRVCKVNYAAVRRWRDNGRLPRTELTGETEYARAIAKAVAQQVSVRMLLEQTRKSFAKR